MPESPASDEPAMSPTAEADGYSTTEPGFPTSDDPAVGETIDRFIVRKVLGRGGMGLVVAAHDPRLDREVAIKLVRSSSGADVSADGKARLLREARAMARFHHPNILSIHEVGEHQGQVYVAMEKVDGGTLRQTLREMDETGKQDWRRILKLFVKAGRGLAAAHAAGMVHRDFKPDNVLIDLADRVLVSDFGIVTRAGASETRASSEETLFADQLTRADSVVGTPAYMAPEQHAGDAVDARADQFSFCVAMYEALYGQLPFAGDTYLAYLDAARCGELRAAPSDRRVPVWLHQVILRGLSPEPEDRFASMEELLIELGADPEQALGLGRTERIVLLGALAFSVFAWSSAVVGLDVELSYSMHYATDGGFLGLLAMLGWFARHALMRSELTRKAFLFVAAMAVSVLVLVAAGQILSIPAQTTGAFHMLVFGASSLVGSLALGPKLIPMGVCYLASFLVAAAYPGLFLPLLLSAHTVGTATAVSISSARPSVAAADAPEQKA